MKPNRTQTYQIGVTQLAKVLKNIKGPKGIDRLVNNKRVMFVNLAPLDLASITATLNGLQYGTTYFVPIYQSKVTLIRTGSSTFTSNIDLTKHLKAV